MSGFASDTSLMPWKKLTARELGLQQGAKLLEGADWVDDEVRFRDERAFAAKWGGEEIVGGIGPGPGLQLRPGAFDDGSPCIRFSCGRKKWQMEENELKQKVRRVPSVHIVVGSVVSFGGKGTHVRVEGMLDLGKSKVTEADITGNKEMQRLGVWRKSIITRQERQFVRCYVTLCRRDWATPNNDQIVQTQLKGTILEIKAEELDNDITWLAVTRQYTVPPEFKASYDEVSEAVSRKNQRAIDGKQKFLARITHAIRDFVESTRNKQDAFSFLKDIYHPLPIGELLRHLVCVVPYHGKNGTRHYDNVAKTLFVVRREFKAEAALATAVWAPKEQSVQQIAPPSREDAAYATAAEAVDAE